MRRVIAGALLTLVAAWGASAEPVQPDQRILFTPAPLGGESTTLEPKSSPPPPSAAIPAPKPRPVRAAHPAPRNRSVNLSKANLDLTGHPSRATSLVTPQPQAVDFSRGVDLGGVSLGLATSHADDGSIPAGAGLVTLDPRAPIPADPALATHQGVIPYFGLSLSAPTN